MLMKKIIFNIKGGIGIIKIMYLNNYYNDIIAGIYEDSL